MRGRTLAPPVSRVDTAHKPGNDCFQFPSQLGTDLTGLTPTLNTLQSLVPAWAFLLGLPETTA